jgi:hypothetical protein
MDMERPPIPDVVPLCPSKEDFVCTYYLGTPVSSMSNHLLPLSCYMAKFLTLSQRCREREVRQPDPSVLLLRVRRAISHRFTLAAVLLVLLVVVLLLFTYPTNGRLISRRTT